MPVNSNKLTKQIMIEVFGAVEIDKNTVMIDSSNIFKFVSRSTKPNDDGGFGTYAGQYIPSVSYLRGVSFTYNVKERTIVSDIPESEYKEVIKNAIYTGISLVRTEKDAKPALYMEHWDDVQKLELSEEDVKNEADNTETLKEEKSSDTDVKALEAVTDINSTGKVTRKAFRTISKAMETTDNIELVTEVLQCSPVAWLALKRTELPREALESVLTEGSYKARVEALRSKHGDYMYKHFKDEFTYSDYTAFIGSKYMDIDTHHGLIDKHWATSSIVFVDSHHLTPPDIIAISKDIIASDLNTMQAKLGTGITFRGVEDIWRRLLDNIAVNDEVIMKLFELKDYYLDSALMVHSKTPQDLKDTIRDIIYKHHRQLLN